MEKYKMFQTTNQLMIHHEAFGIGIVGWGNLTLGQQILPFFTIKISAGPGWLELWHPSHQNSWQIDVHPKRRWYFFHQSHIVSLSPNHHCWCVKIMFFMPPKIWGISWEKTIYTSPRAEKQAIIMGQLKNHHARWCCWKSPISKDDVWKINVPSGKPLHSYWKWQFLMGKSTINGHFQ